VSFTTDISISLKGTTQKDKPEKSMERRPRKEKLDNSSGGREALPSLKMPADTSRGKRKLKNKTGQPARLELQKPLNRTPKTQ